MRQTVRIVDSDEDLLRLVNSTPGAVGIVDVYAINSSVKVLRIDGKLPFDVGCSPRMCRDLARRYFPNGPSMNRPNPAGTYGRRTCQRPVSAQDRTV